MQEPLDQVCCPSFPVTPPKKSSVDTQSVALHFFSHQLGQEEPYKLRFLDQKNPFLAVCSPWGAGGNCIGWRGFFSFCPASHCTADIAGVSRK